MSKSYIIQWKSSINGRAGRGTKQFDWEEANRLAEELNRGYPGIHHEVVEGNAPPAPSRLPEPEPAEPEPAEAGVEITQLNHTPDFAMSA